MDSSSLKKQYLSKFFPRSESELTIGEHTASSLAARFGTPIYVYDAGILRRRATEVRQALGERIKVLYALKANPNAAVAQTLREAGCGVEIASAGEICVARMAGFVGQDAQFAGPGKDSHDLQAAKDFEVGALNVESVPEYEAIASLAREQGHRPGIALRVNPPTAVSGSRMKMGGGQQKFGFAVEDVAGLCRRIIEEDVVELRGLHVYAGTQCFSAEAWVANARSLMEFAQQMERTLDYKFETLNFGGGFAVPCFEGDKSFDLNAAGEGMRALLQEHGRQDQRYFVELGRFLTAPAGVYLTNTIYIKQSKGKTHAILDGGLHHHSAAAGVGSVIRRPFPMLRAREPLASETTKYCVGGPLCTPADEFAGGIELPGLKPGDLVAILASGAYGLTFSNVMFLSHATPAEVLVDGADAWVIRAAGKVEDVLRGQALPGSAPSVA